jgi:hypothetical protein
MVALQSETLAKGGDDDGAGGKDRETEVVGS